MQKEDILAIVYIIIFVIVANIVDMLLRKNSGIKNQKRIKGKIVSYMLDRPRRGRSMATYFADVEYEVNGEKYTVRSKHSASMYNKVGKKIYVTYDAMYPSHAIVEMNISGMLYWLILFAAVMYLLNKFIG